jgi:hypothetical protein
MIDDLVKRLLAINRNYELARGVHADISEAAATIEALRARVAKADELAKQAEHVCSVLKDDNGHAPIRLDQALAAYRATGGAA